MLPRINKEKDVTADKGCLNLDKENADFVNLAKTFALCTAFAANIGGVATLTGTPPNIVFKGVVES